MFINNLEHLLIKKDSKREKYNFNFNRVFKAYNCLMVVFIFKDVVLKIVYDFLVDVRELGYIITYTINNLMVTIVLMLLLGLVINFIKKKTT